MSRLQMWSVMGGVGCVASLVLWSVVGNASHARAGERDREKEALQGVRKSSMRLVQEIKKRDAVDLTDMLTDDFVAITPDGATLDRRRVVKTWVRKGHRLHEWKVVNPKVRLYGYTAIETGVRHITFKKDDEDVVISSTYTWVWVKRGKSWLLASLHESRLPPKD